MVLTISVRHGASELERELSLYPDRLTGAMREGTEDAAIRLLGSIKSGVPFGKVGSDRRSSRPHARDTWGKSVMPTSSGARAVISTGDEVAYYYWSGTKKHPIPRTPKPPGTALAFFWRGRMRYFRQVQHPGTKAHPYVEKGGQQAMPGIEREYVEAVRRVL